MSKEKENNRLTNTQESLQPQRINPEENAYQGVRDIEERLRLGDATNIALTGPYGSGKSSILISLKADYPEYNYLNISLATLQPLQNKKNDQKGGKNGKNNGDNKATTENLDRLIEYSILQQLVYREKQETLPDSRLKRIFHLSTDKVNKITWAIIGALSALIVLFEPASLRIEWICKLLGHKWLNITGDSLSILYIIWFGFKGFKMIVPALSYSKLNKLNLKSDEIEIVKNSNTSIFNIHLDEILYFFERTKYNVVILEDLDRFASTEIFLKLRELNLLLNESKVITRKIFFVYAVRDDMFHNADRVKCFDYITTVIPVINRSNAKSQLKEELRKRGVTEIKDSHLQELGFFLHDMRLLKNIANEYVQYRKKLSNGISCEKLLATIVYKNYYPDDFAKLHDCKGIVYQLINLKDKFISARISSLEAEKVRNIENVEKHRKERHLKESELRRIYLEAYRDHIGNHVQLLKAGDSFQNLREIASNEKLFNQLIASSNVEYSYHEKDYYGRTQTQQTSIDIPFSVIEKNVDSSMSYSDRLEALRKNFEELNETNITEIKKEDIRSQSLSQIMTDLDYQSDPQYAKLKVPMLIEYLVVKGYIDENYYDYISYFYGNFINAHDWEFVLEIKLGKSHPYDYPIDNAEACIAEIPQTSYRKSAILNIGLVDFLAEKHDDKKNGSRLSVIQRTTIENKKYDFLISYFKQGHQQDIVFSTLFTQYKDLWPAFEKHDNNNHQLKLIWYMYAEDELSCEKSRDWLSQHFTFTTDHLLDITEDQWSKLIRKNKYPFKELNSVSNDILKAVNEENAYILNKKNVEILVSYFLDMACDSVSYQLVCETENNQLIERVEAALGFCLESVFSAPENRNETENTIVKILYSLNATELEKIDYLSNQQKKINLDVIESAEVKKLALKCNVVESNWENVIHYLNNVSEMMLDEEIITFIEHHANKLSSIKIPQKSDDERMLLHQLIKTDLLSFEAYSKIINQFTNWKLNGIPLIEERRVKLLIEKNIILFKEINTTDLLEKYSTDIIVTYLMKNKGDFLAHPDSVKFNTEVALGIIRSNLTTREKAIIIPHFTKEILNESLSDEIIDVLVEQEIELNVDLLLKVMELSKRTDNKIIVLNYTLEKNRFDEETITLFLKTLPEKYKEIAEKGKKPEIPNNTRTRKLIHILKEQKYISSFSESKHGIRVYTRHK